MANPSGIAKETERFSRSIGHGLMSERRTNNNYMEMKMLAMQKE
jgi:hypothetical protein